MLAMIHAVLAAIRVFFRSRLATSLEVLALRQQVAVLKRKRRRPSLNRLDRFFWTTLRSIWPRWSDVLVIVKPETVIRWHRVGFRLYLRWRSRTCVGRPKVSEEIRTLIGRMATENSDWGAPRIHGELQKLGFEVSRTHGHEASSMDTAVSWRSRQTLAGVPHNHREAIVAFDFFTLPTLTFQFLYCFFVIEHSRRKILYFNVTRHPTSDWVIQELREVFPEAAPYRYVIFDHDCKFDADISTFLQATGFQTKRTSVEAPWQNGTAERWVGSCRREILDHVIAWNETHLRRLIRDYVTYYHDDRTHDALDKDTLHRRPVERKPSPVAKVTSGPRLGGLHDRYGWSEAP